MTSHNTARRSRNRQGMTEYIVIVGLLALLMIKAVSTFQEKLAGGFDKGAKKIETDITQKLQ